jgi:hypothetical protein
MMTFLQTKKNIVNKKPLTKLQITIIRIWNCKTI